MTRLRAEIQRGFDQQLCPALLDEHRSIQRELIAAGIKPPRGANPETWLSSVDDWYRLCLAIGADPNTATSMDKIVHLAAAWRHRQDMLNESRAEALGASPSTAHLLPRDQPRRSGATRKQQQLKWVAEASSIVLREPWKSDKEIAREVGKDPAQLSRNQTYKEVAKRARAKATIARGHVVKDEDRGGKCVEAYDEADTERMEDLDAKIDRDMAQRKKGRNALLKKRR